MSDTVLSGRWVVYYEAENRQKRVYRDTAVSPTTTDTVNELYSALQDLFDELTQMDDGVPMSAQTPTEYTIGIIDAGDDDPWFIDRTSIEYLTGGAIKTADWARVQDSNTGIVQITYTVDGADFVASDIGKPVVNTDGDTGTLLDYNTTLSPKIAWIRPTDDTSTHNWDSTGGSITVTGGTGDVDQATVAVTGESLWANVYSLGTIEANTHLYIYQNGSNLTAYKASTDWWGDGHLNGTEGILVNVKEVDTEVDEGYITVLARQYSKTCDYYIVDLSGGGRNPIPLSTGDDLNNETGYRQMVLTDASDNFTVGEIIEDDTDPTIQGIITSSTGTAPNITIQYYLIGDPLTDFSAATGGFTGQTSGETATAVDPTNAGPAALSGLSITHSADETFDIDENGTTENYSIVIDCSDEALTDVFEWCKYITRRGDTNTSNTDGIEGEQYIGSDYRIIYNTITGTINEGDTVQQPKTGTATAEGMVVAHNTTDKILILRNSRGSFNQTEDIGKDGSNFVTITGTSPCSAISPIKACPYGSFAGGVFFCAPGVVLDNVAAADINNFQLVDDNSNVVTAPTKVSVTVGNTRTGTPPAGDKISVFRLDGSGGEIDKGRYSATVQSAGATTVVIDDGPNGPGGDIHYTEPGKTSGGVLRLVDVSAEQEYRLRFDSWSGTTFNLDEHTGLTAEGTNATTLTDNEATFQTWETAGTLKIGDLIRNITETAVAYVVTIDSETQLTTTPVTDWTGDSYEINTLPVDTATDDTIYVPFIDAYETVGSDGSPGSETVLVEYQTGQPTIYTRVRARNAGNIVPFEQDSTITSTGMSVNVIRTPDTIYA